MRRREFIRDFSLWGAATAGAALLPCRTSTAQSEFKRPLIAWAGAPPPGRSLPPFMVEFFNSFMLGLSDAGYVQGRNINVVRRAEVLPDRMASIEEMILKLSPDIVLAPSTLEAVAVRKATSSIPIVCPALADAVHLGLIASEARPGGNVTGIEPYVAGLPTKQIELAREIAPNASRIGLLTNLADPKGPPQMVDLRGACRTLGLTVVEADASSPDDISAALGTLARKQVDVVVVLQTSFLLFSSERIAAFAREERLPTVFGYREHVAMGGLVSYGVDLRWCYRRAAYFADKILKGTRPGDLPIEFPSNFWLAVNLGTAKLLGRQLPTPLLTRADEVIE
ncbi:ABC transporter substrate-binding protein [Bradyrhizobium liaoningense]|nr:ABC transporter substrate-binding protein [Bradyrhizobium liaoningense]